LGNWLFKAKKLILTLWAVLQPINLYLVNLIALDGDRQILVLAPKLWVGGKFAL